MQVKFGDTVMVCGSLPRDAVFRTVGDRHTPLCKFGLKVGERAADDGSDRRDAVWCNCTCWREVAVAASRLSKGDVVLAVGRVQEHTYTNRDGDEAVGRELVCEGVFVMGFAGSPGVPAEPVRLETPDDEEIVSDDDLPF